MPTRDEPRNTLLAIATDLLAQTEAQHRTAVRLEDAARQLARGARDRANPADIVRGQLRGMRDLLDSQQALLDEIERQLPGSRS